MSECNYCAFKRINSRADARGMKVTKLYDAKWGMGGVNIYVHPKDINVSELPGGEDGERSKYREAWYMELPTSCCC